MAASGGSCEAASSASWEPEKAARTWSTLAKTFLPMGWRVSARSSVCGHGADHRHRF